MKWMNFRKIKKKTNITEMIKKNQASVVHLTHNDFDAVGSDAIHRLAYGKNNVCTIWASVGAFPSLFEQVSEIEGKGKILSISDLAVRNGFIPFVKRTKENGWTIHWRDHHRWTNEEIADVRGLVDQLVISTNQCACGICAQTLLPDNPLATEIAHVVCDYDLWKHTDPRSHQLGLVLQRHKNREYVRDLIMMGIFEDDYIRQEFASINREMEDAMRKSERGMVFYNNKYKTIITKNNGYTSETAAYLRKKYDSDVEILISNNGRFSIRSKHPISHLVAREFRGGGHPEASGGRFSFTLADKLKFILLKKNPHYNLIAQKVETCTKKIIKNE
jgi:oligoribonuclease NrnB/cAMP/cGMP phosphodiesterase (DHH superfamily)